MGQRYSLWATKYGTDPVVASRIGRFYERKAAKGNPLVALKAVAHKLARAAYHIMRTHEQFDETRAFG